VAGVTINHVVGAHQGEAGGVVGYSLLTALDPLLRCVTLAAIRTQPAGMDVGMTVGTAGSHKGEAGVFVAFPAMGFLVPAFQGITCCGMIEFRKVLGGTPGPFTMAKAAIKFHGSVRVDGFGAILTMGSTGGCKDDQNQNHLPF